MTTRKQLIQKGIDKLCDHLEETLKETNLYSDVVKLKTMNVETITTFLQEKIIPFEKDVEACLEHLLESYQFDDEILDKVDQEKLKKFIQYFMKVFE